MPKMKYNKEFRSGVVALLFCIALFGFTFTHSVLSEIQYQRIIVHMQETTATITEIDSRYSRYGGRVQEIQICYAVDGKTYERELGTDTSHSVSAGRHTNFREGDTVTIYYDPQNPSTIATALTHSAAIRIMIFSGISLFLVAGLLLLMIVKKERYLITEDEWQAQKNAKKKRKTAEKEAYKNAKGIQIRAQYFNLWLLGLICLFVLIFTMLLCNTFFGENGTKISSGAEMFSLIFLCTVLSSPLWILSLCNRRFFGKVLCAVNQEGIVRGRRLYRWEDIHEVEWRLGEGVYVRGEALDLNIPKAPFLMLGKIKKYNCRVKVYVAPKSILALLAAPLAAAGIAALIHFFA